MGFPLGVNMSASTRRNDLTMYNNVTTATGPAMTWAMFAVGYISLGEGYEAKAAQMFNKSFANVHPPFGSWMETPTGGTPNFLTGAGGFLQGAFCGYTGLRVNDTAMSFRPVLPVGWTSIKLRGIAYKGSRLDIAYTTAVRVTLLRDSRNKNGVAKTKAPPALQLVDAAGTKHALQSGATVVLPALQGFAVVEAAAGRPGPSASGTSPHMPCPPHLAPPVPSPERQMATTPG